mgnify:CR=1 FL=1
MDWSICIKFLDRGRFILNLNFWLFQLFISESINELFFGFLFWSKNLIDLSYIRPKRTFSSKVFFFHELLSFSSFVSVHIKCLKEDIFNLFFTVRRFFNCVSFRTNLFGLRIDFWFKGILSFNLFLHFQILLLWFSGVLLDLSLFVCYSLLQNFGFLTYRLLMNERFGFLSFMTFASCFDKERMTLISFVFKRFNSRRKLFKTFLSFFKVLLFLKQIFFSKRNFRFSFW